MSKKRTKTSTTKTIHPPIRRMPHARMYKGPMLLTNLSSRECNHHIIHGPCHVRCLINIMPPFMKLPCRGTFQIFRHRPRKYPLHVSKESLPPNLGGTLTLDNAKSTKFRVTTVRTTLSQAHHTTSATTPDQFWSPSGRS